MSKIYRDRCQRILIVIYSIDKGQMEEMEEEMREAYRIALRKEAWKRVAETAVKHLTRKYQPLVEAVNEMTQEDTP